MRIAPTLAGVAVAATLAVALAGCVQTTPPVIPTSQASSTPVFATDADALAAAKKAYVAYLAVSDEVSADGGKNAERLAPLVTAKWLPTEMKSYSSFEQTGDKFVGSSKFTSIKLQQQSTNGADLADVQTYICADVSDTRLIDSKGRDITPSGRANLYPIVARFESKSSNSAVLLFAGSQPWSGKSFC
jgi:hypothetical protein